MISRTNRRFRKLLADLPPHVRKQARDAYRLWMRDPWHASLHFKQVHATKPVFSARVGLDWRAVCVRSGETCVWFFVGSHADYDKLLKSL